MNSFSYSFPLWFITGYWIQFPVLYSRTLLFIHLIHNSLHLLIPNSQSISPLLPLPKPHLGFRLISKRYLVMQNNILMENSQHTSKTLQIKLSVIYLFIYIEVELIYHVVVITAVQHSDSVIYTVQWFSYIYLYIYIYNIHIYTYTLFQIFFPYRLLKILSIFPCVIQ